MYDDIDDPFNFDFDLSDLDIGGNIKDQQDDYAVIVNKSKGYCCTRCGDFNQYAIANQKDGTFKCYSCRKYG